MEMRTVAASGLCPDGQRFGLVGFAARRAAGRKQGATMTFRRFCTHLPDATFAVLAIACGFGVAIAPAISAPKKPAPPVLTDWGGWYGGVYLGGGFGSSPWSNPDDGDLGTTNLSGIIVGL